VTRFSPEERTHRLRVFQKRVFRGIFEPKREEALQHWKQLHNEEINNFHSSADISMMIKSRRMRWVGHVACMGEVRIP
jgi:hypothetical protein